MLAIYYADKILETQMKVDLADKELLESKQDIYEEEVREKSKLISEQAAVRRLVMVPQMC